ncbi:MAG: hypothetical protein M0Z51_01570 [Propionibacterium sp.]|nr:hypothetical protein [Propionibacterium sp.]
MRRLRRRWGRVAPLVGLLIFAVALFTCGYGVQRALVTGGLRRADWASLALGAATVASVWVAAALAGVHRARRRAER